MSLQIWLPLNGDLHNQGIKNINVVNSGATVNDNGKIGKCYSFNGSSNKIINTLPSTISSSVGSLACWVKMNSLPGSSSFYNLLQLGDLGGYAKCRLGLYMEYTNYINISIDGSSTGTNRYTHSMIANQWYHLCVTYDGTVVKLYINGNEVFSKNASKGSYTTAASNFYIGGTSSYYLNGYMNDARYYNRALSSIEVKKISQGLILHYPLNRRGWGQDNLILNSSTLSINKLNNDLGSKTEYWAANVGQSYANFSGGEQVILSFDLEMIIRTLPVSMTVYNTNNKGPIQFPTSAAGPQINALNPSIGDTIKTRIIIPATMIKRSDSTVNNNFIEFYTVYGSNNFYKITNIKLEMGNKNTPWCPNSSETLYDTLGLNNNLQYDTSGYQNNGTIIGNIQIINDNPKYSVVTSFDGITSGVLIQNLQLSNIINTEITYSFWIKPEGENGARSVYFGSYSSTSWSIEKYSSNQLRLWWGGSPDEYASTVIIADNIWQHIAITKNGTNNIKVYLNGELKWTSTATHNNLTFPTTFRLGRDSRQNDGTPYHGKMSDFRIYATALSEKDILSLYNNGAYIDQLNEIHGEVR